METNDSSQSATVRPNQAINFRKLSFWAFIAFGLIILTQEAGFFFDGRSHYEAQCKELIGKDEVFQKYRLSFKELGNGETYERGRPNETTGYYTRYLFQAGAGQFRAACFTDPKKNLVRAEVTGGMGTTCYEPNGRQRGCWETR